LTDKRDPYLVDETNRQSPATEQRFSRAAAHDVVEHARDRDDLSDCSSTRRRLALGDLPSGARTLAASLLVVCVAAGAGIIAFGLGVPLPGGSEEIKGAGSVPRAITVFAYAGAALTVVGLVGAASQQGWRFERFTYVVIAVTGAALAGEMVWSGLQMAMFVPEIFPLALPLIILLLAGSAYVAALILALFGRRLARWAPVAAMSLAATPFVLGLATYLVAGLLSGKNLVGLGQNHPQAVIGASVHGVILAIGFSVTVLFLWQASVGAAAACEAGVAAALRTDRWRGFFLVAISAKLAWLLLGYAGLLPRALGGSADVWAMSRADGAVGWGLTCAPG
jgi:hypothetical protein